MTTTTFDTYAQHDPLVFTPEGALIGSYQDWVQREYVADEYTISAASPAEFAGLAYHEAIMALPDQTDRGEMAEEEDSVDILI